MCLQEDAFRQTIEEALIEFGIVQGLAPGDIVFVVPDNTLERDAYEIRVLHAFLRPADNGCADLLFVVIRNFYVGEQVQSLQEPFVNCCFGVSCLGSDDESQAGLTVFKIET